MTLPTFLGIGVQRAGTTWLHEVLAAHPQVYVPHRRKELHFFDLYYDRGIGWYEKFFPSEEEALRYQAIGEITPRYSYCPQCPERIAATLSHPSLIIMLRNPVDRAYSHYSFAVQHMNYTGTFEGFLESNPRAAERGFYADMFRQYLRYFDRERFLVLIFEQAMSDIPGTKSALAHFLDVGLEGFRPSVGDRKVNPSYLPKARGLYGVFTRVARWFRARDIDWLVNLGKGLGAKSWFGQGAALRPMSLETRERLERTYRDSIEDLEALLGLNLDCWKSRTGSETRAGLETEPHV